MLHPPGRTAADGKYIRAYADASFVRLELIRPGRGLVEAHYAAHAGWEGFGRLVDFILSGPVLAGILVAGRGAPIAGLRALIGKYDGSTYPSLRRRFKAIGRPDHENLIHAADSPESALREAELWFGPGALTTANCDRKEPDG